MIRTHKQHGFTLLEMLLVAVIMGLLAAIAIPTFARMQREDRLRAITRQLIGTLREARSMASKGREVDLGGTTVRARSSGIRFRSSTVFEVFIDADNTRGNGNDQLLRTVDLSQSYTNNRARIISPIGAEIRFRSDGIASQVPPVAGPIQITIADTEISKDRVINITGVGHVRLVD